MVEHINLEPYWPNLIRFMRQQKSVKSIQDQVKILVDYYGEPDDYERAYRQGQLDKSRGYMSNEYSDHKQQRAYLRGYNDI